MSLEEDAMLVAIGRMSMEEAREKWADDWASFIQALTRWKSVHQFLRMGQLLKTQYQLTDNQAFLKLQEFNYKETIAQIDRIRWNLENFTIPDLEASKAFRRFPTDEEGNTVEILTQKLGKNRKLKYDYKTDIYIWDFHSVYDKEFNEVVAYQEQLDDALQYQQIQKRKIDKQIAETERNLNKAKDEYDITKPYAMGLLVADVFYSLAAALQGDIY